MAEIKIVDIQGDEHEAFPRNLPCNFCEFDEIPVAGLAYGEEVRCPSCGKLHWISHYYEKDSKWHSYLHPYFD